MNILWSAQAEADLDAIHAFIARDSEHYADLQIKRLVERVVYVASHPMSGHHVHDASCRRIAGGAFKLLQDYLSQI